MPPKVLIIEDEALIAANLEMVLEDAGCEIVGWATDAHEAWEIARREGPQVAFVDIQLRNGDDGIELASGLQAAGVEVIFVTAQSDPATMAKAQAVPHRAYIRKPYKAESIVAALP